MAASLVTPSDLRTVLPLADELGLGVLPMRPLGADCRASEVTRSGQSSVDSRP